MNYLYFISLQISLVQFLSSKILPTSQCKQQIEILIEKLIIPQLFLIQNKIYSKYVKLPINLTLTLKNDRNDNQYQAILVKQPNIFEFQGDKCVYTFNTQLNLSVNINELQYDDYIYLEIQIFQHIFKAKIDLFTELLNHQKFNNGYKEVILNYNDNNIKLLVQIRPTSDISIIYTDLDKEQLYKNQIENQLIVSEQEQIQQQSYNIEEIINANEQYLTKIAHNLYKQDLLNQYDVKNNSQVFEQRQQNIYLKGNAYINIIDGISPQILCKQLNQNSKISINRDIQNQPYDQQRCKQLLDCQDKQEIIDNQQFKTHINQQDFTIFQQSLNLQQEMYLEEDFNKSIMSQQQIQQIKTLLKQPYQIKPDQEQMNLINNFAQQIINKYENSLQILLFVNDCSQIQFDQIQKNSLDLIIYILSKSKNKILRHECINLLQTYQAQDIQKYLMQLTLQLKYDQNDELQAILINFATQLENIYTFAQFPFYLNAWKETFNDDQKVSDYYKICLEHYLFEVKLQQPEFYKEITRSLQFVTEVYSLVSTVKSQTQDRLEQRQKLINELEKKDKYPVLTGTEPTYLPFIGQDVYVAGCIPQKSVVFKSAKKPFLIVFNQVQNKHKRQSSEFQVDDILSYKSDQTNQNIYLLFKYNDDVRTDQLVTTIFQTFIQQLHDANIKPSEIFYSAFAFTHNFGVVQCIMPSKSLDAIFLDQSEIKIINLRDNRMKKHQRQIMEMKQHINMSSATQSLFSYLLAIGDRHNENILVTHDGNLFHIDFGWLFGRDPKPGAAKMKITADMIDTLGGVDGKQFETWLNLLIQEFLVLKKWNNVKVILAMLYGLQSSQINVIEEDVVADFPWLQDRFMLDLNETEAKMEMVKLVKQQLEAVFPKIIDSLHRWIQSQRK